MYENEEMQSYLAKYMKKTIRKYGSLSRHEKVDLVKGYPHIIRSNLRIQDLISGDVPKDNELQVDFVVKAMEGNVVQVIALASSTFSYKILSDVVKYKDDEESMRMLSMLIEKFIHEVLAPSIFPDARVYVERHGNK